MTDDEDAVEPIQSPLADKITEPSNGVFSKTEASRFHYNINDDVQRNRFRQLICQSVRKITEEASEE